MECNELYSRVDFDPWTSDRIYIGLSATPAVMDRIMELEHIGSADSMSEDDYPRVGVVRTSCWNNLYEDQDRMWIEEMCDSLSEINILDYGLVIVSFSRWDDSYTTKYWGDLEPDVDLDLRMTALPVQYV